MKKRTFKVSVPRKPEVQKTVLPSVIKREDLTPESIEILEHFGLNSPHLLNEYCITLEDALIEQVTRAQQLTSGLIRANDEISRLRALLPPKDQHPGLQTTD